MSDLALTKAQEIDGADAIKTRGHVMPYNAKYAEMALRAMHDGITLREFCRTQRQIDPEFPVTSAIYYWALYNETFAARFNLARRAQAHHWAEDIVEISDNGTNDWMERRRLDGSISSKVNHECVQRSKLRVDTRKWLLAKLHPDVYAERIQHQTLGADGMPVDPPSSVTPIDLTAALKQWKPKV